MSEVEFHEEQQFTRTQPKAAKTSFITGLVIKSGLARDEQGAQKVLIGIIGLCILITGFAYFFGLRDTTPPAAFEESGAIIP